MTDGGDIAFRVWITELLDTQGIDLTGVKASKSALPISKHLE